MTWETEPRACMTCGALMPTEGYMDQDGAVYCAPSCAGYSEEEYDEMHDDNDDPALFWTTWESEERPLREDELDPKRHCVSCLGRYLPDSRAFGFPSQLCEKCLTKFYPTGGQS